ncbi:zinc finger B-box domain-containing protein 1 [Sphaeramia orbicularis]|uniref:zinc finger B-box domain-containing protein 1 n=1 Tax=Sphaeramia orbicularis TaxID=375764 RepID=UPI00117C7B92|nr:zinc finger B-box domain-containing protein 1 [Sphaeramia orbicularis]
MNLNDFVVVPNNTAKSVKLNARNLQELKMETVVLAQESTEMEDKLQQLKERMSKEKKERVHSGGFRWKSGQSGPLNSNAMRINAKRNEENRLQKLSAGTVKIRVLKDEPLTAPAQPPPPPLAPTKGMGIRTVPTRKNRLKGPTCGQCDVKAAGIMCAECSEDYCICCFAKFHQRGALKFHRIIPIQAEIQTHVNTQDVVRCFQAQTESCYPSTVSSLKPSPKSKRASRFLSNSVTRQGDNVPENPNDHIAEHMQLHLEPSQVFVVSHKENRSVEVVDEEQKGEKEQLPASLLSGLYDEEESARSFQEALRQWRGGGGGGGGGPMIEGAVWVPVQPAELSAMATQTDLSPDRGGREEREPVRVEFMEYTLTYMDRLLLKKHRRTPVECYHPSLDLSTDINPLLNTNTEEQTASALTAQEEDFHQYCVSLFAVPVSSGRTEPQITRPESYLTIVDDLDEETDMNGVFVPEKRADLNRKVPSVHQVSSKQRTTSINTGPSSLSPTQPKTKPSLKFHPSKSQVSPQGASGKALSEQKPFAHPSTETTPDTYKTSLKPETSKHKGPNWSPAVHKTKSGCESPQSPSLLLCPPRPLSQIEIPTSYSLPSFHPNASLLGSSPSVMPEDHLSSPGISCTLRSTFTVSPSSSVESALLPKIYQSTPLQNSSDSTVLPEQLQSSQLYPEPISSPKNSQSTASNLDSQKQSQHSLSDPEGLLSGNQGQIPPLPVSSSPNALVKSMEPVSSPWGTNPVSSQAPVRTPPNVSSLYPLESLTGAYSRSRSAHDYTYEDAPVRLSSTSVSVDHESCLSYQDTQHIRSVPSHLLNVSQSPPSPGEIGEEKNLPLDSEDEMSSDSLGLVPHEEAYLDEAAKIHQFLQRGTSKEGNRGKTATPHLEDFFVRAGEERENDLQTDEPEHLSEASMVIPGLFRHVDRFSPQDLGINSVHSLEYTHTEAMQQCQPLLHASDPTESAEYRSCNNLSTYFKKEENNNTQPPGKSDISANEAATSDPDPTFRPLSCAAREIMEICNVDQTGCEDPDLDADTSSHALSSLERELRLQAKETGTQVLVVATGNRGTQDQQGNHRFTRCRVKDEQQEEEEDRESVLLLP